MTDIVEELGGKKELYPDERYVLFAFVANHVVGRRSRGIKIKASLQVELIDVRKKFAYAERRS